MLITAVASLGSILIEWAFGASAVPTSFRQSIAGSIAFAIVGLPIWALHWSVAQRFARNDPAERSAALRRLYLYGVSAALLLSVGLLAARSLEEALRLV